METLREVLGLGRQPSELGVLQVCVRGVVVFFAVLVMVRVAHKRFLARMTAFDAVLGFMLASALARAINGSAPFLPTLAVGFVLAYLHRFLAMLAFRFPKLSNLIKGHCNVLVENGKPDPQAMREHHVTESDILESARLHAEVDAIQKIRTATLERSGQISVIATKEK